MNPLGVTVALVLLVGAWAQVNVLQPECDSPEAEEAALVVQDYLNAQHTQGYKYALNRIEDIKIITTPTGENIYILDLDLLETDCHVLDPTPLANCTVRPKRLTAIEGDCEVELKRVNGTFTVTAFKCKTEESTEDLCVGCPNLLPLDDTAALDFVHASLVSINNYTVNETFDILQIGRMSTQVVSGGPIYLAEFIIVEANCVNNTCLPLVDNNAARGICSAQGLITDHRVDCRMFDVQVPAVDANSTDGANNVANTVPEVLPLVQVQKGIQTPTQSLTYHKLTAVHNPLQSSYLSAESAESGESEEVVPVVPAVVRNAATPAADPAPADPAPADPSSDPAPADPSSDPALADLAPVDPSADPFAADPSADPFAVDPFAADPAPTAAGVPDVAAGPVPDDSTSAAEGANSKENFPHFKRDLAAVSSPAVHADTIVLLPRCPGRVRYF